MKILTKKAQKELLKRLAANEIIAKAALIKANMDNKSYCDFVDYLIDNTIQCAILIAGVDGALTVQNMVDSKREKILRTILK